MNRRDCLQLLTGFSMATWASGAHGQAAEPAKEVPKAIPTIEPPDPNPKTPVFKLPPKSCDAHTHIFGPASRYPFSPKVMPNDGDIVDLIPLYAPDAAIQKKLLVDNPARLFKFT
jgi:hypothetical protein